VITLGVTVLAGAAGPLLALGRSARR
jgi:hypothetical protein